MPEVLTLSEVARMRAASQLLTDGPPRAPEDTARWMLALQAQDFAGSLWAVALRDRAGETRAAIEAALSDGRLVRSWPLRGTLHLTAAADLRPLLAVSAARTIAATRGRRAQLGLTDADLDRSNELAREALAGGRALRRPDLMAEFTAHRLDTTGQRAAHLLLHLSLTGVTCLGPTVGRAQAIVLLDDWVPGAAPDRDAVLPALAARYVASHGPVQVSDLAWWAGIPRGEAARALAQAGDRVAEVPTEAGPMWIADDSPAADPAAVRAASSALRLLPPFDELLLGYTDRGAGLDPAFADRVSPGANGVFRPIVSDGGRIVGTWRVQRTRPPAVIPDGFAPLPDARRPAFDAAAAAHLRFAATR